MEPNLQPATILVHCVSGRNRSATVVCAILMWTCRISASAALKWLQRVRPIVHPCNGYQRGLLMIENIIDKQSPWDKSHEHFVCPVSPGGGMCSRTPQPLEKVLWGDARSVMEVPLPANSMQGMQAGDEITVHGKPVDSGAIKKAHFDYINKGGSHTVVHLFLHLHIQSY